MSQTELERLQIMNAALLHLIIYGKMQNETVQKALLQLNLVPYEMYEAR